MAEDFITKYCASTVAMIVILGPFFGGNLRSDRSPEGDAITLGNMRYVTSVIINQVRRQRESVFTSADACGSSQLLLVLLALCAR